MKLLLGTANKNKIDAYKRYLNDARLELLTPFEIGIIDEPLEIGETFFDNAFLKAKFYAEKTEYPTLADDGGLEVDALNGEPGVNSRRWVGVDGTDADRVQKVIDRMQGIPEDERTARFRVITLIYLPEFREHIFVEKTTEGVIPERASKKLIPGFPYRSVLFLPKFNKFMSELSEEELNSIDHRGAACKELLLKLEPYLNA